jgi:hypothetical protein
VKETTRDAPGETPRDRWVDTGIWTVGLTAAVASWAGWVGLAKMCGWTDSWTTPIGVTVYLAWLLPFAVDIYALIGFRVWLRINWASETTRVYARRSTFVAIGLGVAGNAGYHLMVSLHWGDNPLTVDKVELAAPWLVVVGVSALPPIMLGAVAHLSALATRDLSAHRKTADPTTAAVTSETYETAAGETPASRAETTVRAPSQTSEADASARPAIPRPQTPKRTRPKTEHRGLRIVSQTSDEDSVKVLRETYPKWETEEVSLGQIKAALGITGQATAVRLKRALYGGETPSEASRREAEDDPKEESRELVAAGA